MAARYRLRDGEAMHRESPRTFSIPRSEVRRDLEVGALVKLVFGLPRPADDGCDAERMWCQVTARQGRGFVGRLVNRPLYVEGLEYGDDVPFQPRHVVAIDTAGKKRLAPLVGIGVDVLRGNRWPTWVTKVEPAAKHDSGWRIFSDREARSGATLRALSGETMFRSWAVLDSVVDPYGSGVWRWDKKHLEYRRYLEPPAGLATAAAEPLGRLHRPAPPADHRVVITRKALGKKPAFAQRLGSNGEDDSGWCIFVGDEPQAYLDEPKNSTVVPVARVLHEYPSYERVLGEPGKKLWRWDDDGADWIEVTAEPPTRRPASGRGRSSSGRRRRGAA